MNIFGRKIVKFCFRKWLTLLWERRSLARKKDTTFLLKCHEHQSISYTTCMPFKDEMTHDKLLSFHRIAWGVSEYGNWNLHQNIFLVYLKPLNWILQMKPASFIFNTFWHCSKWRDHFGKTAWSHTHFDEPARWSS